MADPSPKPEDAKPAAGENSGIGSLVSVITAAASAVGVFFGLFGGILTDMAPPVDMAGKPFSAGTAQFFTCLVVLILYAVVLVTGSKTDRRRSNRIWLGVVVVFAVLAVASFFGYQKAHSTLVFRYPPEAAREDQTVKVAGLVRSDMTRHDPKLRDLDNSHLLEEWGGDENKAWQPASIPAARQRLLAAYLAFALAAAIAFFGSAELVRRGVTSGSQ